MSPIDLPPPDFDSLKTIAAHVALQTQATTAISQHLERLLSTNKVPIAARGPLQPALAERLLGVARDLETVHGAAAKVAEQLKVELQIVSLRKQELDVRQQLVEAREDAHAAMASRFVEVTQRLAAADATLDAAIDASIRVRRRLVVGMAAVLVLPGLTVLLLRAVGL